MSKWWAVVFFSFLFPLELGSPLFPPKYIFFSRACLVPPHLLISLPSSPCTLPVPVSLSSAASPGTYLLLFLFRVTFRHHRWNQNPSGLRRISRSTPIDEGGGKKNPLSINGVLTKGNPVHWDSVSRVCVLLMCVRALLSLPTLSLRTSSKWRSLG